MRQPAKTFQDLIIWQKAHQFILLVYPFTAHFPKSEIYGLTSQFRRAGISIPANIAEGFKKKGLADKVRFLNIAQGSLEECRYYSGSRLSEVQEPDPQPPPRSSIGGYDLPHLIRKRYI